MGMDIAAIIDLYDAAKDKGEQIRLMTSMGFGSRNQILQVLHANERALDFKIKKPGPKPKAKLASEEKPAEAAPEKEPAEAAADEKPLNDKRTEALPIPYDVKQLLIDELEGIDASIREVQEIIDAKKIEKQRLETLYQHIVECVGR